MIQVRVDVHEFKGGLVRLSHDGWSIPVWIPTKDIAFMVDNNRWWCLLEPEQAYVYGMREKGEHQ